MMGVAAVLYFQPRFADMRMQRHVESDSQVRTRPEQFRRRRIPGMWSDGRPDARVILPFFNKSPAACQSFFIRGSVGSGEDQNSLTEQRARACGIRALLRKPLDIAAFRQQVERLLAAS